MPQLTEDIDQQLDIPFLHYLIKQVYYFTYLTCSCHFYDIFGRKRRTLSFRIATIFKELIGNHSQYSYSNDLNPQNFNDMLVFLGEQCFFSFQPNINFLLFFLQNHNQVNHPLRTH